MVGPEIPFHVAWPLAVLLTPVWLLSKARSLRLLAGIPAGRYWWSMAAVGLVGICAMAVSDRSGFEQEREELRAAVDKAAEAVEEPAAADLLQAALLRPRGDLQNLYQLDDAPAVRAGVERLVDRAALDADTRLSVYLWAGAAEYLRVYRNGRVRAAYLRPLRPDPASDVAPDLEFLEWRHGDIRHSFMWHALGPHVEARRTVRKGWRAGGVRRGRAGRVDGDALMDGARPLSPVCEAARRIPGAMSLRRRWKPLSDAGAAKWCLTPLGAAALRHSQRDARIACVSASLRLV